MNRKRYYNSTAFLDLLFNLVLGFVLLFIFSFRLINPSLKKTDTNVKTKAEFMITVTWPDSSKDDVDTWVQDPTGRRLSYRNKDLPTAHLDRDDRGLYADTITLPDGRLIICPHNQELTTIRGIMSGEWILNIHMYAKRESEPTPIEVRIDKLNPSIKTLLIEKYVFTKYWDQETVARFTISPSGEIVNWSKLPIDLVGKELQAGGM